jgi:hypothetical protein
MWVYEGKNIESIEDFPQNTYGFVYQVTHLPSQKKYIGKKVLYHNKTLPPLKGTKRKRKVVKESDWKTYYGSQKEIKDIVKQSLPSEFERLILRITFSKKLLTYYELKYLCSTGAIEPNSTYINDNISGRFFRKDFL